MSLIEATAQPHRHHTQPLRIFVDREEVPVDCVEPATAEAPSRGHRMQFTPPAGTTTLRLASPLRYHEVDIRLLGVAIQQIVMGDRVVPLDGPATHSGFYRLEKDGGISWRWTNSDAVVVLPELPDPACLTVAIAPWSLPPASPGQGQGHGQGMRAALVSWDIAHNPVSPAHVIYELLQSDWTPELIGPAWPRFGTALWAPLRNSAPTLRSFPAQSLLGVWTHGASLRPRGGQQAAPARLDMAIGEAFRNFNPARGRASEALTILRRETRWARRTPAEVTRMAARQDLLLFCIKNYYRLFR